jgi:hypothetical protein
MMLLNKFEFVDNGDDLSKLEGSYSLKITEVFNIDLGMIEV